MRISCQSQVSPTLMDPMTKLRSSRGISIMTGNLHVYLASNLNGYLSMRHLLVVDDVMCDAIGS